MLLKLRSQLCAFENCTKCNEISFDQDSFSEQVRDQFQMDKRNGQLLITAARNTT